MERRTFKKRVVALMVAAIMALTILPVGLMADGYEYGGGSSDYVSVGSDYAAADEAATEEAVAPEDDSDLFVCVCDPADEDEAAEEAAEDSEYAADADDADYDVAEGDEDYGYEVEADDEEEPTYCPICECYEIEDDYYTYGTEEDGEEDEFLPNVVLPFSANLPGTPGNLDAVRAQAAADGNDIVFDMRDVADLTAHFAGTNNRGVVGQAGGIVYVSNFSAAAGGGGHDSIGWGWAPLTLLRPSDDVAPGGVLHITGRAGIGGEPIVGNPGIVRFFSAGVVGNVNDADNSLPLSFTASLPLTSAILSVPLEIRWNFWGGGLGDPIPANFAFSIDDMVVVYEEYVPFVCAAEGCANCWGLCTDDDCTCATPTPTISSVPAPPANAVLALSTEPGFQGTAFGWPENFWGNTVATRFRQAGLSEGRAGIISLGGTRILATRNRSGNDQAIQMFFYAGHAETWSVGDAVTVTGSVIGAVPAGAQMNVGGTTVAIPASGVFTVEHLVVAADVGANINIGTTNAPNMNFFVYDIVLAPAVLLTQAETDELLAEAVAAVEAVIAANQTDDDEFVFTIAYATLLADIDAALAALGAPTVTRTGTLTQTADRLHGNLTLTVDPARLEPGVDNTAVVEIDYYIEVVTDPEIIAGAAEEAIEELLESEAFLAEISGETTEASILAAVRAALGLVPAFSGVTATIADFELVPAVNGTAANPAGTPGSITGEITLTVTIDGETATRTIEFDFELEAAAFIPPPDLGPGPDGDVVWQFSQCDAIQGLTIGQVYLFSVANNIAPPIRSAGSPVVTAVAGAVGDVSLHVTSRANSWYTLDLHFNVEGGITLPEGNYSITIAGRTQQPTAAIGRTDTPYGELAAGTVSDGAFVINHDFVLPIADAGVRGFRINIPHGAAEAHDFFLDEVIISQADDAGAGEPGVTEVVWDMSDWLAEAEFDEDNVLVAGGAGGVMAAGSIITNTGGNIRVETTQTWGAGFDVVVGDEVPVTVDGEQLIAPSPIPFQVGDTLVAVLRFVELAPGSNQMRIFLNHTPMNWGGLQAIGGTPTVAVGEDVTISIPITEAILADPTNRIRFGMQDGHEGIFYIISLEVLRVGEGGEEEGGGGPVITPVDPGQGGGAAFAPPAAPPATGSTQIAESQVTVGSVPARLRIVNGRATVQLTANAVRDLIAASNDYVEFDFSDLNIVSLSIPRSVMRQIAAAGLGMDVILPQGAFLLDTETVAKLAAEAHTNAVTFRITEIVSMQMTPALAGIIPAGASVYQVVISAGSRVFNHLDEVSVIVVLASPGATATVQRVSRIGLRTRLLPVYSAVESGVVVFDTNELGLFVVGS